MGKKKRPAVEGAAPAPSGPFHGAFSGLEALREKLPPGEAASEAEDAPASGEPPAPPARETPRLRGNLVVRHERKGRGGKTVTLLIGLHASEEERQALARQLARALGCAARVEEETLVLGGDLRSRLEQWLHERGARVRLG